MNSRSFSIVILAVLLFALVSPAMAQQRTQLRPQSMHAASTNSMQPDSANLYWFQVGAWATNGAGYGSSFGAPVTGASVDIRVNSNQGVVDPDSDLAYWVGINLPGNSFIQVGYEISEADSYPHWFWAYFLHDASTPSATCDLTCPVGDNIGPNGTWYHFSLESSGTIWHALMNGEQIGSVDLGVENSGGNGPYAAAEVAGTRNIHEVLGPVEFRNLEYRDTSGAWHQASAAQSLCCYGAGSDTYLGNYPYGVQSVPGQNNYWIAGSKLNDPIQQQGDYLWPWYQVNVEGLPAGWTYPNGWSIYGSSIDLSNVPQVIFPQDTSRYFLEGWYVNGVLENGSGMGIWDATENMTLKPNYVQQWFVQVNSNIGTSVGSGWYNDGASATITVNPAYVRSSGVLGMFGVGSILKGWQGSYHGPVVNGESQFKVTSPMDINAVWGTDYGVLPYYSLLLLPTIGLVFYWRKIRKE